jgi:apolipoprotein N-acyltransferase
MRFTKLQLFGLSILSGLLLAVSWHHVLIDATWLIFFAFVPLFIIEKQVSKAWTFFGFSYLSFFIFNFITTWWIYYASFFGAAVAIILNSLFMALVAYFYYQIKNRTAGKNNHWVFIFLWISFEYLHMDWDLSWTWLTLGNVFAENHTWIQWYEYTGVFGGSLWILLINILIFKAIDTYLLLKQNLFLKNILALLLLLILPITISKLIYNNYEEKGDKSEVVVVQPNFDPYNEKFVTSGKEQLDRILSLATKELTQNTDFLVLPETALPEGIFENELENGFDINYLRDFLKKYPNLEIVTGISTYKFYENSEKTPTARKSRNGDYHYDAFNTAMSLNQSDLEIYHKSKLVPGVELMPFPAVFKYLDKFAIDLGGIAGSLGADPERKVFTHPKKSFKVAPVICYESIYGEFVTEYMWKGANAIFIITNDGWWDNTAGYKQHLSYARLRAIENRKSIARSANTGISAFVNQKGDISQPTNWWVQAVIKENVLMNNEITFYQKYGDFIGRVFSLITALLFIWWISSSLRNRKI